VLLGPDAASGTIHSHHILTDRGTRGLCLIGDGGGACECRLADAVTATVRKTLNFSTSLELLPAFPTSPTINLAPRPKLVTFGVGSLLTRAEASYALGRAYPAHLSVWFTTGKLTTFGQGDYLLSWDDDRVKTQHAVCLIDLQKGS